ncbi:L,D-transpeptidase Cds6 family protein [Salinisphaera sp.]|uniref:L,D-transpeptidase Cds6 family protein n=1 Tax=Salinisphaera sp. TaxID=1914330 RepID=UPI002D79FDE2|nr:tetratricopeptide repeat protein [Salinisphaera sp.]HET7315298.1 tetratricopeptide repeat protein [Salinisphaera sp.]
MNPIWRRMACAFALTASLPAAAAAWDAAAVARDLDSGQASRALAAARARLADQPNDPQARFFQAMAKARIGDIAGAIDGYRMLAAQYPQRARVWNNLGVLYARRGRLEAARRALARAVAAEPGYAAARSNLGDIYAALAQRAWLAARQQGADAQAMQRRLDGLRQALPALANVPAAPANAAAPAKLSRAIDAVLARWARARSQQNVAAYLAVYSNNYQPAGDTTRAQWLRNQRARLSQPPSVRVSVSDVQVAPAGAKRAQASFHEHYRSPKADRRLTKHMLFVHEDGAWRILRES